MLECDENGELDINEIKSYINDEMLLVTPLTFYIGIGKSFETLQEALSVVERQEMQGKGEIILVLDDGIHEIGIDRHPVGWYDSLYTMSNMITIKSASGNKEDVTITVDSEADYEGASRVIMFSVIAGGVLTFQNLTLNPFVGEHVEKLDTGSVASEGGQVIVSNCNYHAKETSVSSGNHSIFYDVVFYGEEGTGKFVLNSRSSAVLKLHNITFKDTAPLYSEWSLLFTADAGTIKIGGTLTEDGNTANINKTAYGKIQKDSSCIYREGFSIHTEDLQILEDGKILAPNLNVANITEDKQLVTKEFYDSKNFFAIHQPNLPIEDISEQPDWTTIFEINEQSMPVGIFEICTHNIFTFRTTSYTIKCRFSFDGGQTWVEFSKEQKDQYDKMPFFYAYPFQNETATNRHFIYQASKTAGSTTELDLIYGSMWIKGIGL